MQSPLDGRCDAHAEHSRVRLNGRVHLRRALVSVCSMSNKLRQTWDRRTAVDVQTNDP